MLQLQLLASQAALPQQQQQQLCSRALRRTAAVLSLSRHWPTNTSRSEIHTCIYCTLVHVQCGSSQLRCVWWVLLYTATHCSVSHILWRIVLYLFIYLLFARNHKCDNHMLKQASGYIHLFIEEQVAFNDWQATDANVIVDNMVYESCFVHSSL